MSGPYRLIAPKGERVPIVISVPHTGTAFPDQVRPRYRAEMINPPDDTDFFVERVYEFATEMGITIIYAHYSRWFIDLNRSPNNQSLYQDGRLITDLTPVTDFLGDPIYVDEEAQPTAADTDRRKWLFYEPYYEQIQEQLNELKQEFGHALLWDAHSIRRSVPTIHSEPFPDFILGNNDETTAHPSLIEAALKGLSAADHQLTHNTPFKGGNITRHFGQPHTGIHALQLEMIKPLYMDDTEQLYDPQRAAALQNILQPTFELLIQALAKLDPLAI